MAIRVLRIIEYTFKDERTAAENIRRMTHTVPSATVPSATTMRMRSALLPLESVEWIDDERDD